MSNAINTITGILLYSDGNFLQVLEGDEQAIQNLYAKISSDTRHHTIIKIIEDSITERQFPNWKMAYSKVSNEFLEKNKDINPFKLNSKTNKFDKIVITFIETFIRTHRKKIYTTSE